MTSTKVLLSTFLHFMAGLVVCSCYRNMERQLVDDLSAHYHSSLRPTQNLSEPTVIHLGVKLIQIFELNAKQQVMVMSVWIEQSWTDHSLRWNKTKYGGIDEIILIDDHLWVPDIVLLNNADKESMGKPVNQGNALMVSSNGTIRWLAPVILKSSCKLNVRLFPFDEQYCPLKFASWTNSRSRVVIEPQDTEITDNYKESSEWSLKGVSTLKTSSKPTHSSRERKSAIHYFIHIKRHVFYYFVYLLTPCMLTSLMTFILFILPPESGERMVVGVTLLLSLTVFFLLASTHIPKTSEVVPLVGRYYSLVIIEVSCCLGLTCWVLRFHHYNRSFGQVTPWIRIYILGYVANLVRYPVPEKSKSGTHFATDAETAISGRTSEAGSNHDDGVRRRLPREPSGINMMAERVLKKQEDDAIQEEWQLTARVINRFFMILYIFTVIFTTAGIFLQISDVLGPRLKPPTADS